MVTAAVGNESTYQHTLPRVSIALTEVFTGHSVGRDKTSQSFQRGHGRPYRGSDGTIPRHKDVSKLESLGSIPGNRQGMSKAQTH